ncbi:MAG: UPF0149 family protein [Chromatiales bacterium]|nr:MAG: UPF0149 family protein [Chromatiales bacterium]
MTEALSHAGALGEAAELHGQLCGLACLLGVEAGPPWVAESLQDCHGDAAARETAAQTLAAVAASTLEALDLGDMSLALLLPDDETPVDSRASALGLWCQGFMHGLSQGAATPESLETGVTGEIIRDFSEISRATLGAEETLTEAEEAYAELVEFVRVSAQLVFEELHAQRRGGGGGGGEPEH